MTRDELGGLRALAMIPARGGSKRIPRKNIRPFLGRPIMTYSIQAALNADVFAKVIVSTDDAEIEAVARAAGAEVPFRRSAENSNDVATTGAVIAEVLDEYEKRGERFDLVCCIYPCAPLMKPEHLTGALKRLRESGADSVVPVLRFGYPVQRAVRIEADRITMVSPEYRNTRSQDLEPLYHDAGQFYWLRVDRFRETKQLLIGRVAPMILSDVDAQDIDSLDDWTLAELKYQARARS